jgi:aminoglycoside phosphotransferase (APT) family kinase protein
MSALNGSDVPVPEALHLCEDESIIGSVFIVMSYIEGRTFWKPSLPDLSPTQRAACYQSINKTLAAIHSVDINKVGLSDYGKAGNYFDHLRIIQEGR